MLVMSTVYSDRENKWTQSIAVGSKSFVEKMKEALGYRATGRKIICANDTLCYCGPTPRHHSLAAEAWRYPDREMSKRMGVLGRGNSVFGSMNQKG